jgi:YggT family protein
MSGLITVAYFLVSTFFSLLIFALWLRVILRYFCISAMNPVSKLIYSLTDPLFKPLSFIYKPQAQQLVRYDWLTLGVLVVVEFLKIICLSFLAFHTLLPLFWLVVYVVADLIIQPCTFFFYAIIIRVLMTYLRPGWRHPAMDVVRITTEPFLILGRRIISDVSGFDFSPFIILMILKTITLIIESALPWKLF